MLAEKVGRLLKGCEWVGIPFAGGMSEVARIDARTVVVNDLHRHVINLAGVVADPDLCPKLVAKLDALPFHPDTLAAAQERCLSRESGCGSKRLSETLDVLLQGTEYDGRLQWAADYFTCAWMGRNGIAGTDGEFRAGLSLRWEAGGGDSAVRFRSATESLAEWQRVMRRCTFSTLDAFEFLAKCKDRDGHGIYSDAPWPSDGEKYRHKFDEARQRRLAEALAAFKRARVVVRFGDHPLIRELYPETLWYWHELTGRTAANRAKAEVLLTNRRMAGSAPSSSTGRRRSRRCAASSTSTAPAPRRTSCGWSTSGASSRFCPRTNWARLRCGRTAARC